ncbi:MAG: lysylphosphatidylglycerol synthase transmembrane domain-containing protein [Halobacteria archaeon]
MNSKLYKLLWFGVSTFIIGIVIYLTDTQKFFNALSDADVLPLIPALIFGILGFMVLGYTWHRFLRKIDLSVSYLESFRLFLGGQFLNSVTPLGQFGGEPFMAYIIKKHTESSYEEAFSAVLSADIVNGTPMLTFVIGSVAYLYLIGELSTEIVNSFYVIIAIAAIGAFFVYLMWFQSSRMESYLRTFAGFFKKILGKITSDDGSEEEKDSEGSVRDRVDEIKDAFRTIGENPRQLFVTAGYTHLFFVFQVVSLFIILKYSLGFRESRVAVLFVVIAISNLANFTPTPGGTGAYEVGMAGLMDLLMGTNFELALSASILFRLTTFWPGLILGYLSIITLDTAVEGDKVGEELDANESPGE